MPAPTAKKASPCVSLSIREPERFIALHQIFERRKVGHLSLSAMVRIALDEWIEAQGNGRPK